MEKTDEVGAVKRKVIVSTFSLFFQSGYSAGLGLFANLVLTILLSPQVFGIYFTVLSLIAILNYFSDIGLAASLIQKKEIEDKDVSTVFTFQQLMILSVIFIGWMATSIIMSFYKLPLEGQYLYWALLLAFFLSSLKTIPSVFLERKIKFQKIVLVQVLENTVFYCTVIIMAFLGWGLTSFTIGVILRATVGLIAIYWLSPWKIKIGIDISALKKHLTFGVPFQMSSFLALVKDDLLILYLGKVLGFQTLGYIGWAKKWAEAPIRIIMDSLSRVLFPLFSRIQDNFNKTKKVVEKTIFYQSAVIIPSIFGLALLMPKLVYLIPKYTKWIPALPFFFLFCLSALLSSYSTPFINLLNGLGKTKISFRFMLVWTILTWILTPILTRIIGEFGFPVILVFLSSSFVVVIYTAKNYVKFSFLPNVYPFLLSAIIMTIVVYAIINLPFAPTLILIIAIGGGIIMYLSILKLIFSIDLIKEIKQLTS